MKQSYFILFLYVFLLTACQNKQQESKLYIPTSPSLIEGRYNVGILIMDGVYSTELTDRMDIFQHTIFRKGIKAMNVFLVATDLDVVTFFEDLRILPDYSYLDGKHPDIDILVVPSAEKYLDTDLENQVFIDWVAKVGWKAEYVTSHFDGAFVLAKAGLLDKVASNTFPSDIAKYKFFFLI